jgi:hypothetical protein
MAMSWLSDPPLTAEDRYRRSVRDGLVVMYDLADRRDIAALRKRFGEIEEAAARLCGVCVAGHPLPTAGLGGDILRGLCERFGRVDRSLPSLLGLHAASHIAWAIADECHDVDAAMARLDEAEDVAAAICVLHLAAAPGYLAKTIVAEVERRFADELDELMVK